MAQVGFSLPLIGRLIKEFPDIVVGLKDSSGDWSNTAAILATYPGFEVFPGSEIFLLDGLRKGAAGCISATCNVSAAAIRNVYDNWQRPEADQLQADITALRKAIQAYPDDPGAEGDHRPLPAGPRLGQAAPALRRACPPPRPTRSSARLAEAHGFKLDFAKAA